MLTVWFFLVLVTFISSVVALPLGFSGSSAGLMAGGSLVVFPFKAPSTLGGDLNTLEARDTSSPCSELDLDDLQSLPGWPKLVKFAYDRWGGGEYEIEINPSGYDDVPATMCVADPTVIVPTGKPKCTHHRVDIPPSSGHDVKVESGYKNVGHWNITQVTTAAHALFFKGSFRTPNMTTPPSGTYLNTRLYSLDTVGEFINAPFNSFVTVASNMTHKTESLTQQHDRTCIATINQQLCIVPARGRIQLVATGYVWFKYKTKRAPRGNQWGPKHHRYSVNLEEALPDVRDRSAWIDFSGVMNTTLRSDYFDECRWNFAL